MALPLHIEFRTLPMLFYVPPMLPIQAVCGDGVVRQGSDRLFHDIDEARAPLRYLANLFGAGDPAPVSYAVRKQTAVRWYRRSLTVGDVTEREAERALRDADCTPAEADAIYKLTSLCTAGERFVLPPGHREQAAVGPSPSGGGLA